MINKPISLLIAIFLPCLIWGQAPSVLDEEVAIRTMLQKETEAFTKKSLADVAQEFWLLDDKTLLLVTFPDGTHLSHKAADLLLLTDAPPEGHATFEKSEHKITIMNDLAYDTHDQTVILEDGSRQYSHEIRILRKINGVWKIHISSVHQFGLPE
jgi:hypothetical protein